MATTTTGYSQWFIGAVGQVAREAFRTLCEKPYGAVYLYYKPHGLAFKAAHEDDADPRADGFVLAMGERIPGNFTVEQLEHRFRDVLSKVPVLPGDA